MGYFDMTVLALSVKCVICMSVRVDADSISVFPCTLTGGSMTVTIFIAIVAAIAGLIVIMGLLKRQPSGGECYESRGGLFTTAERSFLEALEQALDSRYRVFGKVRLGDLITPAGDHTSGKRIAMFNRINQNQVDFVVCTASELALVGVIALEDQSYGHEDRAGRGGFVDLALAMAGIPVLRFPAKNGYQVLEVRARLSELLHPKADDRLDAHRVGLTRNPTLEAIMDSRPAQPDSDATACPSCSAAMVKRQVVTGSNAGGYFWACSTFPVCCQVVKIG
jgi:hypothetical protein